MKKVALALWLICGSCLASDWIAVRESSDGSMTSLDIASIGGYQGLLKAWTKRTFPLPQKTIGKSNSYSTMKVLSYFDCSRKSFGIAQQVLYSDPADTQTSKSSLRPLGKIKFQNIVPNSVGEAVLTMVCSFEPAVYGLKSAKGKAYKTVKQRLGKQKKVKPVSKRNKI